MHTCDFIAKYLKKRGVKQVFGTPGSDTINLINAFSDQGIKYVLTLPITKQTLDWRAAWECQQSHSLLHSWNNQ